MRVIKLGAVRNVLGGPGETKLAVSGIDQDVVDGDRGQIRRNDGRNVVISCYSLVATC